MKSESVVNEFVGVGKGGTLHSCQIFTSHAALFLARIRMLKLLVDDIGKG